jgi:hypothetical protein
MRRAVLALILALASAASCRHASDDEGRDAALMVKGAQFYRDNWPQEVEGPRVRSLTVLPSYAAGATDRTCAGDLDPAGAAVAIAIDGDIGYWVLPAGVPSANAENAPTFDALISFSERLTPGPRDLVVRAIDKERRFGPPEIRSVNITERGIPAGELVVALSWNNTADLDLHVVDPRGVEIFKRNPNSYEPPPPGVTEKPGTPHDGGVLDIDSNAGCREPDGRRAENVVWTAEPPAGHYLVRVDTFSLCGEAAAFWRLSVYRRGLRIAATEGVSTQNEERYAHNRGDGLLAVEFDVK